MTIKADFEKTCLFKDELYTGFVQVIETKPNKIIGRYFYLGLRSNTPQCIDSEFEKIWITSIHKWEPFNLAKVPKRFSFSK
jgi:hypothetical protein